MILKYDLPKNAERMITLTGDERIYYAVPIDIDESGCFTTDSFFVVTTAKLCVIRGKEYKEYLIRDLDKASAEPGIGGGLLTVRKGDAHTVLAHYSSKHLTRYAYIARGINILISGRFEEVISPEYEKVCPICGRAIPGTKECPKCSGKGGFLSVFTKMAAPYKKDFLGIFLVMVLVAVTTLLNPEVQKHLINDVLSTGGKMHPQN